MKLPKVHYESADSSEEFVAAFKHIKDRNIRLAAYLKADFGMHCDRMDDSDWLETAKHILKLIGAKTK